MLEQHRPYCFLFGYTRPFSLEMQRVASVPPLRLQALVGIVFEAEVPAKSHL